MKTVSQTLHSMLARAVKSGDTILGIANESGIAQPSLHRFYTGQRGLSLESIDKLAAYFELELKPAAKRMSRAGP